MNILVHLKKSLFVLLITLSLLLNVSVGAVIVLVWRLIINVQKMSDLLKTGTLTAATVVRVEKSVARSISIGTPKQTTSRIRYRLVARWQHPQTGKGYTLRAPIPQPENFPVGSSVNFYVNLDDPRIHRLADVLGAFTPIDSHSPSQDA